MLRLRLRWPGRIGSRTLCASSKLARTAAGKALDEILAALGHVAEGVRSAPMVLARAAACGVEMPIVAAVAEVLAGRIAPEHALEQLMRREARPESSRGGGSQAEPA